MTSTSASFGVVHVGSLLSQGITLSTNGSDSQYTRVTVANGSNGFLTVSGGSNPTFNGPAVTDNRTLSGIAGTAGAERHDHPDNHRRGPRRRVADQCASAL